MIGGLDRPTDPFALVPRTRPTEVDIRDAGPDEALGPMRGAGEIDALLTANVPQTFLEGSTRIRRLFVDDEAVEGD